LHGVFLFCIFYIESETQTGAEKDKKLVFLESSMSQKNQPLASPRKLPLGLGKMIILLFCLALPVVFYLLSGHPAFIVVFISGMISISITIARVSNKR
jgi:hypothetical protein